MSMFGDGTKKEDIYQELSYIYRDRYNGDIEDSQEALNFVIDVLDVLQYWFGEQLMENWECYWATEGEKLVDGEYFPETYCRLYKFCPCEPGQVCRRYVRRDKIDDYIRYLLEELDYYYKLP